MHIEREDMDHKKNAEKSHKKNDEKKPKNNAKNHSKNSMSQRIRVAALMLFLVVITCLVYSNKREKEGLYYPGTYQTQVQGHNTKIMLSVRVSENEILAIDILEHSETSGIADPAIKQIPKRIVEGQTLAVDTITSCTITSAAILSGVEKALIQAGAEVELLKEIKKEEKEIEEIHRGADVIVIGGGLAGLSAATTVAELGGTVIVLEKMENCGGNTMRSGGTLNAVDPERQEKQGIIDSVELYIKNTYESGGGKGDINLIRTLCENSKAARDFISDHGGEWQDNIYLTIGGLWPRSLDAKNNATETLIDPLIRAIEKNGGEIILNCKAEELILEEGRVVGVKAQHTLDGTNYTFTANKGVVMATGGFSANSEMVSNYNKKIPENNPTTNSPCATGDGIIMCEAVGANLVDMEYIQLHPNAGTNVYFTGMIENSIYVNQYGERFVNEESARTKVCEAMLNQPGGVGYVIFDSNTINEEFWSTQDGYQDFVQLAKEGKCGYGETLEELAHSIGVDPKKLRNTVRKFNLTVEGLAEDEYGRELLYKKIGDGPFYASIRTAKTHSTLGGVQIDEHAQVLNEKGEGIKGLYACGEVTGGIHGENRIGGNSLTECVVFGRIAGKSLMEESR